MQRSLRTDATSARSRTRRFWNHRLSQPELSDPLLQRFIGVVYRPESERQSHCYYARIAEQYDALIHVDRTRAVEPLERAPHWDVPEVPETFPTGV